MFTCCKDQSHLSPQQFSTQCLYTQLRIWTYGIRIGISLRQYQACVYMYKYRWFTLSSTCMYNWCRICIISLWNLGGPLTSKYLKKTEIVYIMEPTIQLSLPAVGCYSLAPAYSLYLHPISEAQYCHIVEFCTPTCWFVCGIVSLSSGSLHWNIS